ncbi:MAG: prolipoprotein diacylglyceryl transferase [Planctomycetes bacterium]|nr:prolipoprotein diacylglyceryl transferase [Planctomycetota bacterium]
MKQLFLTIPVKTDSVEIFGFGVLLAIWAVFSLGLIVYLVRRQGWGADTLSYLPLLLLIGGAIYGLPMLFPEGLPIRGYGVMMLLAVVSGVALTVYRARLVGLKVEIIYSLAFWVFITGIVGGRLMHIINYWDNYRHGDDGKLRTWGETLKAMLDIPSGGLVVFGALIAVSIMLAIFVRRNRLPGLALCDLIAPSMVLGLALGRIGCLLNGCCYGGLCEAPWAVQFPAEAPPYQHHFKAGQIHGIVLSERDDDSPVIRRVIPGSVAEIAGLAEGDRIRKIGNVGVVTVDMATLRLRHVLGDEFDIATDRGTVTLSPARPERSLPVHPTQIYSAINALLLCLFLLAYYPYRRRDGEVFALLLTLYPISRYLLEIIRADEITRASESGLTHAMAISIAIIVGVTAMWFVILRRPVGTVFPKAV